MVKNEGFSEYSLQLCGKPSGKGFCVMEKAEEEGGKQKQDLLYGEMAACWI